jgi:hypothetical protein
MTLQLAELQRCREIAKKEQIARRRPAAATPSRARVKRKCTGLAAYSDLVPFSVPRLGYGFSAARCCGQLFDPVPFFGGGGVLTAEQVFPTLAAVVRVSSAVVLGMIGYPVNCFCHPLPARREAGLCSAPSISACDLGCGGPCSTELVEISAGMPAVRPLSPDYVVNEADGKLMLVRTDEAAARPAQFQVNVRPGAARAPLRMDTCPSRFVLGCGLNPHGADTMTRTAFGLAGIAAALLAAPALAHHSFAMFDQSQVLYKSGTVKELQFTNPHAWLEVVVNDNGNASTWAFEGGSVPQLIRLGWTKDAFKVGDEIKVGFRPMKDGSRGGQLMSVEFTNGQHVCSNRGCGDGTGTILNGTPAEHAQ